MDGQKDPKLPRHDPRLLEASLKSAKEFYRYDQQLSQADRRQLSGMFWQRMVISPVFSLPVACGFIMLPNALKKRKIFFNPQKRYFFLQVFLGFVGLGIGQAMGSGLISAYQRSRLQSNDAALGAYNSLSSYPSQLGSQYFAMTARNSKFIMKDPNTINWQQNPLFPIFLIVNKELVTELRHAEEERIETYREHQLEQRQKAIDQRAGGAPTELTGTSWDNIIKHNEDAANKPSSQSSQPPSTNTLHSQSSSSQPSSSNLSSSSPSSSSSSNSNSSNFGIWDNTSQPTDDFTESEKKW